MSDENSYQMHDFANSKHFLKVTKILISRLVNRRILNGISQDSFECEIMHLMKILLKHNPAILADSVPNLPANETRNQPFRHF